MRTGELSSTRKQLRENISQKPTAISSSLLDRPFGAGRYTPFIWDAVSVLVAGFFFVFLFFIFSLILFFSFFLHKHSQVHPRAMKTRTSPGKQILNTKYIRYRAAQPHSLWHWRRTKMECGKAATVFRSEQWALCRAFNWILDR